MRVIDLKQTEPRTNREIGTVSVPSRGMRVIDQPRVICNSHIVKDN